MKLKPLTALKNITGQRIFVRCDFDVPVKNGRITDDSRLKSCLPTVQYLLKNKARIILAGHLGRPEGQIVPELSLLPIKKQLEKLLGHKVIFVTQMENYLGSAAKEAARNMRAGEIIMLENLRFSEREELNCRRFGRELASLAKYYINEAFAVSHRAAVSVSAIREYLPGYAGLHLSEEIAKLSAAQKPSHPLALIIGGAKIETKLPVIKKFIGLADYILVGGGVANDFFKAIGYEVGQSLVDEEYIKDASSILERVTQAKTKLILPVDVKVAAGRKIAVKESHNVSSKEMILDIGPKTIKFYEELIKKSKMIIWNGPMGKFEDPKFSRGTKLTAQTLLKSQAKILVGGGETGELFKSKVKRPASPNASQGGQKSKLRKNLFVSVGGGAMLEFLAGKKLPGLE